MKIEVLLFGPVREAFSTPRIAVDVMAPATAGDVVAALASLRPGQKGLLQRCRVAVDRSLVAMETEIEPAAEVAIIPPVGGG